MNTPGICAGKAIGIRGKELPIMRPKRVGRTWYTVTVITVKRAAPLLDQRQQNA